MVRPHVRRVRDLPCGDLRIYLDAEGLRVDCRRCGGVNRERLAQAGEPRPAVIGVDEISIRKGHVYPGYRIVVSDLERGRPISFGGVDRSETSLTMCYDFLGAPCTQRIRLAVMDMWKPFRTMTETHRPRRARCRVATDAPASSFLIVTRSSATP